MKSSDLRPAIVIVHFFFIKKKKKKKKKKLNIKKKNAPILNKVHFGVSPLEFW